MEKAIRTHKTRFKPPASPKGFVIDHGKSYCCCGLSSFVRSVFVKVLFYDVVSCQSTFFFDAFRGLSFVSLAFPSYCHVCLFFVCIIRNKNTKQEYIIPVFSKHLWQKVTEILREGNTLPRYYFKR